MWRPLAPCVGSAWQSLGSSNAYDVALADADGDSDLDACLGNGLSGAQPDEVWLNRGGLQGGTEGQFADSGQSTGAAWSYAVALGNLDGDPLPDAFVANWFPNPNSVFLNAGGAYSDTGQALGNSASLGVALGMSTGIRTWTHSSRTTSPTPTPCG